MIALSCGVFVVEVFIYSRSLGGSIAYVFLSPKSNAGGNEWFEAIAGREFESSLCMNASDHEIS